MLVDTKGTTALSSLHEYNKNQNLKNNGKAGCWRKEKEIEKKTTLVKIWKVQVKNCCKSVDDRCFAMPAESLFCCLQKTEQAVTNVSVTRKAFVDVHASLFLIKKCLFICCIFWGLKRVYVTH